MLSLLADGFRRFLPSPFSIALLLTLLAVVLSFFISYQGSVNEHVAVLANGWVKGVFRADLLMFGFQAMLMLVLGHMLAIAPPVNRFLTRVANAIAGNTVRAVVGVAAVTMVLGWLNWGFGLIAGAILARKVAEVAASWHATMNYPLLGAAGYTGMVIWHGGLSGSALIKAAENGHLSALYPHANMPESIGFNETVFSSMNVLVCTGIFLGVLLVLFALAKWKPEEGVPSAFLVTEKDNDQSSTERPHPVDSRSIMNVLAGVLVIFSFGASIADRDLSKLDWITPNFINGVLFGVVLLVNKSINSVLSSAEEAIGGTTGILLQFPLYFGIMGIMTDSGMLSAIAKGLVEISSPTTFPIFTFISSALVNVFIPSGGGQWAVQGPVVLQGASELQLPLSKCLLAFAYGDQITNMLQPFWALPLLGITKLKARDIFPYTFIIMLAAGLVVLLALAVL
ncbi:MAG: hypothetical protein RL226_2032 [Bacteroidota bacterium]|jgi:short-chain fatty acids transporter